MSASSTLARVAAHGVLIAAPLAAAGRLVELARPQALACIAALITFAEVEHASRSAPDPARLGAPGTQLARISALGLLTTAWAAIGFPSFVSSLAWLGLVAIALGVALRALAIRALGAAFSSEIVVIPGQRLVTHGIYAHLRHPSDVGLLLVALGLAWLGGSAPAAVIALSVVAPSVVVRMLREDAVLAKYRMGRCQTVAPRARG
jgi:protein-S-isoprenylcysteine O-methyltransferase Ste14